MLEWRLCAGSSFPTRPRCETTVVQTELTLSAERLLVARALRAAHVWSQASLHAVDCRAPKAFLKQSLGHTCTSPSASLSKLCRGCRMRGWDSCSQCFKATRNPRVATVARVSDDHDGPGLRLLLARHTQTFPRAVAVATFATHCAFTLLVLQAENAAKGVRRRRPGWQRRKRQLVLWSRSSPCDV